MAYFDFKRLVKKYSKQVTVIIPAVGDYDDYGDYQEGKPTETTLEGAVIRHRQNKINQSNGVLTEDDYAFYVTEKPAFNIIGTTVICDNQQFTVKSKLDNSEFTGVWGFNLKYISAFNGKEGVND